MEPRSIDSSVIASPPPSEPGGPDTHSLDSGLTAVKTVYVNQAAGASRDVHKARRKVLWVKYKGLHIMCQALGRFPGATVAASRANDGVAPGPITGPVRPPVDVADEPPAAQTHGVGPTRRPSTGE